MASAIVEGIVNQTISDSFGGRDIFESIANSSEHRAAVAERTGGYLAAGGPSSSAILDDQLDSLAQQAFNSIEMSPGERLVWILLFSVMVLVAAGGNTMVVYIVLTNKEMKSVTNYFLVNLSVADTMVSILNVVFNFISMLNSHWPFGKIYCKISNFIAILSISASVFTLTAISCDRYNAILHPLRPRMSHTLALAWIILIWTLSSALSAPNAIYSTIVTERIATESVAITCTMIWPDGRYPLSSYDHIYNIIILVLTYLIPILTMAILYYKVGKELWGSEAIGENIEKQQKALLAKKKIVKMMIVVVIIFALCWLPYHAFFVINFYVPTILQDVPLRYQRAYLIMYWMAMSNSMYNPIIIYFMNSKFRLEFKKILSFVFCCRIYTPPTKSSNTTNNRPNYNQLSTNNRKMAKTKSQLTMAVDLDNHLGQSSSTLTRVDEPSNTVAIVIGHSSNEDAGSRQNLTRISETISIGENSTRNNSNTAGEHEPFIASELIKNNRKLDLNSNNDNNTNNNDRRRSDKFIDMANGNNQRRDIEEKSSIDKVWI